MNGNFMPVYSGFHMTLSLYQGKSKLVLLSLILCSKLGIRKSLKKKVLGSSKLDLAGIFVTWQCNFFSAMLCCTTSSDCHLKSAEILKSNNHDIVLSNGVIYYLHFKSLNLPFKMLPN